MIGIVVKELPFLKLLTPIMDELYNRGVPYILYYMDVAKPNKEYARPTIPRLSINSKIVSHAKKVQAFTSDSQLFGRLVGDKITKIISVELWLFAQNYMGFLAENKIKPYSINYLTDTMWQHYPSAGNVYYTAEHILNTSLAFNNLPRKPEYKTLGSPLFDCINREQNTKSSVMVLLPNIRSEMVSLAFGKASTFIKIIDKIYKGHPNLIFKTRKKQWLPGEIKQYASSIIDDGDVMYPNAMSSILKSTKTTVMFYSSGIYECVYSGSYVLNIPLSFNTWRWDKTKLAKYFSTAPGSLYQFDGVVESITQKQVLEDTWKFTPKTANPQATEQWIKQFIGNLPPNNTKAIVDDILGN